MCVTVCFYTCVYLWGHKSHHTLWGPTRACPHKANVLFYVCGFPSILELGKRLFTITNNSEYSDLNILFSGFERAKFCRNM